MTLFDYFLACVGALLLWGFLCWLAWEYAREQSPWRFLLLLCGAFIGAVVVSCITA